jgi:hypothetical protein
MPNPPGWMIPEHVEEIASVSNCITKEPAEWIGYWRHNEMFVFDSPESALSVVPEKERSDFEIHAYAIFLAQFVKGRELPINLPAVCPQALPDDFELLGYDVVGRSCGTSFECSSLSCNGFAAETPVNRWCLVDDIQAAFDLAARVEPAGGEPGPYFVVEVWRQQRLSSNVEPERVPES